VHDGKDLWKSGFKPQVKECGIADDESHRESTEEVSPLYTQGEMTSQSLWSRYGRHFVGITPYNALS